MFWGREERNEIPCVARDIEANYNLDGPRETNTSSCCSQKHTTSVPLWPWELGRVGPEQGWKKCRVCLLRNFFFSFFGSQRVKDVFATKSTMFQCFMLLAYSGSFQITLALSGSLWLTLAHFGSLWLSLSSSLRHSSAHKVLARPLRCSCVSPVYPALEVVCH